MNEAASDDTSRTSCAISDGSLVRPIGIIGKTVSLALCSLPDMPVKSGVMTDSGAIAFTRMFLRATSRQPRW
jgi:hypothetical protein